MSRRPSINSQEVIQSTTDRAPSRGRSNSIRATSNAGHDNDFRSAARRPSTSTSGVERRFSIRDDNNKAVDGKRRVNVLLTDLQKLQQLNPRRNESNFGSLLKQETERRRFEAEALLDSGVTIPYNLNEDKPTHILGFIQKNGPKFLLQTLFVDELSTHLLRVVMNLLLLTMDYVKIRLSLKPQNRSLLDVAARLEKLSLKLLAEMVEGGLVFVCVHVMMYSFVRDVQEMAMKIILQAVGLSPAAAAQILLSPGAYHAPTPSSHSKPKPRLAMTSVKSSFQLTSTTPAPDTKETVMGTASREIALVDSWSDTQSRKPGKGVYNIVVSAEAGWCKQTVDFVSQMISRTPRLYAAKPPEEVGGIHEEDSVGSTGSDVKFIARDGEYMTISYLLAVCEFSNNHIIALAYCADIIIATASAKSRRASETIAQCSVYSITRNLKRRNDNRPSATGRPIISSGSSSGSSRKKWEGLKLLLKRLHRLETFLSRSERAKAESSDATVKRRGTFGLTNAMSDRSMMQSATQLQELRYAHRQLLVAASVLISKSEAIAHYIVEMPMAEDIIRASITRCLREDEESCRGDQVAPGSGSSPTADSGENYVRRYIAYADGALRNAKTSSEDKQVERRDTFMFNAKDLLKDISPNNPRRLSRLAGDDERSLIAGKSVTERRLSKLAEDDDGRKFSKLNGMGSKSGIGRESASSSHSGSPSDRRRSSSHEESTERYSSVGVNDEQPKAQRQSQLLTSLFASHSELDEDGNSKMPQKASETLAPIDSSLRLGEPTSPSLDGEKYDAVLAGICLRNQLRSRGNNVVWESAVTLDINPRPATSGAGASSSMRRPSRPSTVPTSFQPSPLKSCKFDPTPTSVSKPSIPPPLTPAMVRYGRAKGVDYTQYGTIMRTGIDEQGKKYLDKAKDAFIASHSKQTVSPYACPPSPNGVSMLIPAELFVPHRTAAVQRYSKLKTDASAKLAEERRMAAKAEKKDKLARLERGQKARAGNGGESKASIAASDIQPTASMDFL